MRQHPVPWDIQLDKRPVRPSRRSHHQIRAFTVGLSHTVDVGGLEALPAAMFQHQLVCPLLCRMRGDQPPQLGGHFRVNATATPISKNALFIILQTSVLLVSPNELAILHHRLCSFVVSLAIGCSGNDRHHQQILWQLIASQQFAGCLQDIPRLCRPALL
jgi:hypothetical protein